MADVQDWASDALGTTLGDRGRQERVLTLLRALGQQPGASLSLACDGDWAATQGAYRPLDTPYVDPVALSTSIGQATGQRALRDAPAMLRQRTGFV